jgi:hypothetical protein
MGQVIEKKRGSTIREIGFRRGVQGRARVAEGTGKSAPDTMTGQYGAGRACFRAMTRHGLTASLEVKSTVNSASPQLFLHYAAVSFA